MLTAIRCQAGTRRLWLRMRNLIFEDTKMEGTRVLVYILPAGVPRVARLIKFHLPILPHYSKYEPLEIEDNKRYLLRKPVWNIKYHICINYKYLPNFHLN